MEPVLLDFWGFVRGAQAFMAFPIQSVEAQYEILHKLGEGGMGAVYKVRHRLLGELRVIKVVHAVHAGNARAHRRFEREAKAATALRHPNIAQIYDFVAQEDGAYLVMELIDGLTFKEMLSHLGPLPLPLALELALQSLDALDYLHRQGFLHRDISPDNLMLSRRQDGAPGVKLIDLGLAKGPAETIDLTATNMFVGKVRYASPEVFRRPTDVASAASDLYSFGVVFYEMLTGRCPIVGESFEELMAAHLLRPALGFEVSDPQGRVPGGLRQVVMSLLAKEVGQRPASALVLKGQLAALHETPVEGFEAFWRQCRAIVSSSAAAATLASPLRLGATALTQPPAEGARPQDPRPKAATTSPILPEPTLAGGASQAVPEPRTRGRLGSRLGLAMGLAVLVLAAFLGLDWQRRQEVQPSVRQETQQPVTPTTPIGRGRLHIEATPWAEILGITDGRGEAVPFELPIYTPADLELAAGSYVVRLSHPEAPEDRQVSIEVPTSGTVRLDETLVETDIEAYFRRLGLADELARAGS